MALLYCTCTSWSHATLQPSFPSWDPCIFLCFEWALAIPAGVVASIRIHLALTALIFCLSETEKVANNLHFDLETDLSERSLGWVCCNISLWRDSAFGSPRGRDLPIKPSQQMLTCRPVSCPAAECSAINTMGWAWQHLTTALQNTVITQHSKWKRIKLWWSILALCLVEGWEISQ